MIHTKRASVLIRVIWEHCRQVILLPRADAELDFPPDSAFNASNAHLTDIPGDFVILPGAADDHRIDLRLPRCGKSANDGMRFAGPPETESECEGKMFEMRQLLRRLFSK